MVKGKAAKKKQKSRSGVTGAVKAKIPRIKVERAPSFRSDNPEDKRQLLTLWRSITRNPLFDYQMLWFLIIALSLIGLLMQFSASVILELSAGINPYWGIIRPLVIIAMGFAVMIFISRLPAGYLEKYTLILIFPLAVAGQLAVFTGLGRAQGGNRNWVYVPGINQVFQPSEFLKVAFILLLITVFVSGRCQIDSFSSLAKWVGIPFLIVVATVMGGHDMGTLLIFVSILLCVLLVAGISMRWLGAGIALLALGAVGAVMASSSRRRRVLSFLNPSQADPMGSGLQPLRAKWGLGTGGLTGVGPGASRQKWNYLPEAHTDFIYAILGEEFGLVGTLLVLLLFGLLAWILCRLVIHSANPATRICAGGTLGWIIAQALINILVVIGFLPVVGVPLPLVSSGGSTALATLIQMGVLLSYVRAEPGVAQAAARRPKYLRATSAVRWGKRNGK